MNLNIIVSNVEFDLYLFIYSFTPDLFPKSYTTYIYTDSNLPSKKKKTPCKKP